MPSTRGSIAEPDPASFPLPSYLEECCTPMKRSTRTRAIGLIAVSAAASLALAACGGGGGGGSEGAKTSFNEGTTQVVNPSSATGGTLRFVNSSDFDSMDPGN